MRIVTLLPSATDIVVAMGLGDCIVGISHSCDPPPGADDLPRLTSTVVDTAAGSASIDATVREHLESNVALYELDLPALAALAPDVIVSQGLCDVCAVASGDVERAIAGLPSEPRLIDLTPGRLGDVLADIGRVGRSLGVPERALALAESLERRIDAVRRGRRHGSQPRTGVFLEWLSPPFNGGHWNPELMAAAGLDDPLGQIGLPSRTIAWGDVAAVDPTVIVVSVCGYGPERARADLALLETEPAWLGLEAVRTGRVLVADGHAHFSRPGPALVDGLEWLAAELDRLDLQRAERSMPDTAAS